MSVNKISKSNLILLTSLTLIFFASNSLFCKAALLNENIDAFSFTFFRLFFASFTLLIILFLNTKKIVFDIKSNWANSFFLFLYAITFSYSYFSLDAGLGALVLFGVVQITMILFALFKKENITFKKIFGIILAFVGLTYLLFPKDDFSISIFHFLLMALSGFAWAFYTILGKSSKDVLKDTSSNFIKTLLFCFLFFLMFVDNTNINSYGIFLAFLSGSITSGIAYALWYYVLKNIEIMTASIIQLLVPIITIFLSIIFLEEKLTLTLFISTILILSGIAISLYKRN